VRSKNYRRLLMPEKPLFFWAFVLGRSAMKSILSGFVSAWEIAVDEIGGWRNEVPAARVVGLPIAVGCYVILAIIGGICLCFMVAFTALCFGLWMALLPMCLTISLIGGVLALGSSVYLWWRKRFCGVTLRCVKGSCRFRDVKLAYRCPGCGELYKYLLPNHFGLLYHRCSCGCRMPAIPALGRERLTKCCPECEHIWAQSEEARRELFVALVGGVSTGKTCYLTMSVQALIDQQRTTLERESDRDTHMAKYGILQQGRLLPPTQEGVPEAVVLSLDGKKNIGSRLYLYDASGEEYSRVERGIQEEFVFFRDLSGVILLVDPLGLPKLRQQLDAGDSDVLRLSKSSETPLEDVVASLRRNVRKFLKYGRSGRTHVPLAVVINKADVPEVNYRLGRATIENVGGEQSEHSICRQALVEWGAGSEVSALEHEFASIRYFSCSTLGRVPDGSSRPFVPNGVLSPFAFLLGESSLLK